MAKYSRNIGIPEKSIDIVVNEEPNSLPILEFNLDNNTDNNVENIIIVTINNLNPVPL